MKLAENDNFIRDCIGWDITNWSAILSHWRNAIQDKDSLKVLEIGAGQGGLSLWMASLGHDVLCSDIQNPMKISAELHQKYQYPGTINYQAINVLEIPYSETFDVVFFKSVVGGVSRSGRHENRSLMMEQIHTALKPGGLLLFSENLRSTRLHRFMRKHFVNWGKEWNYPTIEELLMALKIFEEVNYKTTGFIGAFGRSETQRKFLSRFDSLVWNQLLPINWHYVMYGKARKGVN